MRLTRRRFLTIASAACVAAPAQAQAVWKGRALGADASIQLGGVGSDQALNAALDTIRRMERLFSLYDPNSVLSRLNRDGSVDMPPEFSTLIDVAGRMHAVTNGLFDPTVQPVWKAFATGGDWAAAQDQTGWKNVRVDGSDIRFEMTGMAMTLNGIAQGFATDRVKAVLAAHGFEDVIVNVGEYAVGNRSARLGITDTEDMLIKEVHLRAAAIATSSPLSLRLAGGGHILHPADANYEATWGTVSVTSSRAVVADALSTGLCLAPSADLARQMVNDGVADSILLRGLDGAVHEIEAG